MLTTLSWAKAMDEAISNGSAMAAGRRRMVVLAGFVSM
jgi:hypothetical protein